MFLHTYLGAILTGTFAGIVVTFCCAYALVRAHDRWCSAREPADHEALPTTDRSDGGNGDDDLSAFSVDGTSVDLYRINRWPVVVPNHKRDHGRHVRGLLEVAQQPIFNIPPHNSGKPPRSAQSARGKPRGARLVQEPAISGSSSSSDLAWGGSRHSGRGAKLQPLGGGRQLRSSNDDSLGKKWASDGDADGVGGSQGQADQPPRGLHSSASLVEDYERPESGGLVHGGPSDVSLDRTAASANFRTSRNDRGSVVSEPASHPPAAAAPPPATRWKWPTLSKPFKSQDRPLFEDG